AHVAHVASPPSLAAQRQALVKREREVEIDELTPELRATDDGPRGLQESVEAGQSEARFTAFAERVRVADATLEVWEAGLFAVAEAVRVEVERVNRARQADGPCEGEFATARLRLVGGAQ